MQRDFTVVWLSCSNLEQFQNQVRQDNFLYQPEDGTCLTKERRRRVLCSAMTWKHMIKIPCHGRAQHSIYTLFHAHNFAHCTIIEDDKLYKWCSNCALTSLIDRPNFFIPSKSLIFTPSINSVVNTLWNIKKAFQQKKTTTCTCSWPFK